MPGGWNCESAGKLKQEWGRILLETGSPCRTGTRVCWVDVAPAIFSALGMVSAGKEIQFGLERRHFLKSFILYQIWYKPVQDLCQILNQLLHRVQVAIAAYTKAQKFTRT
jgi:hypothetical protein